MKRIAIFCDGTWNAAGGANETNVVRLAQAVPVRGADDVLQQVIYQRGVGTGRGGTGVERFIDRFGGGAFGWGLTENIIDVYRRLILSYEAGDEIYVFGFSRGAYTARSLVGLIRACGIVPRWKIGAVEDALEYYRSTAPNTNPRHPDSIEARAIMSPEVATSQADVEYREENMFPRIHLLKIAYVGVWDTVGSRGIPSVFGGLAKLWNKQYGFHDTKLTSMVRRARHAVATDERRKLYPAALWGNLDVLNDGVMGDLRKYRQDWFAGDHSAVGGSGPRQGLSNITLSWIAQGAGLEGLTFFPEKVRAFEQGSDAHAPLSGHVTAGMFTGLGLLSKDRNGPADLPVDCADISPQVRARAAANASYRPATLAHCLGASPSDEGSVEREGRFTPDIGR